MLRVSILAFLKVSLVLFVSSTELRAQQVKAFCAQEGASIVCDIRDARGKPIRDITAAVAGTRLKPSEVELSQQGGRSAAYYFLVQLTEPITRDAIHIIERLARDKSGGRVFGIGTFSEKLQDRGVLGTKPGDIAVIKEKISKFPREEKESHVDLYRSALDAADRLKSAEAFFKPGPKALVIFSDGRNEYRDSREKFIKTVSENNIIVYTIFMPKAGARESPQRELEQLAAGTNGVALIATCLANKTCDLDEGAIRDFFNYAEQGAQLRFPASAVSSSDELTFSVKLGDGSPAQSQPVSIRFESPPPWWDGARLWVLQNPLTAGGAGAMVLGGLLCARFLLSRRRKFVPKRLERAQPANVSGGKETLVAAANPNPSHVYAWLQFLDAETSRLPIGSTEVRIGRHRDNDIILQNKTVHRKHAILCMGPDRRFSINDLGGENGTLVNGELVKERSLYDADLIELGEVRMRFFTNNS